MTDPTGKSFLSYRRTRQTEAELLIAAQHDVGIPTWQDVKDLGPGPTEDQLRTILQDPLTANGLLWITPDVASSHIIRQVEIPVLASRARVGDAFFMLPVAAAGLSYDQAAHVAETLTLEDFTTWNLQTVQSDPATPTDAANVASRVLSCRLDRIHQAYPPTQPLPLSLHTRVPAPFIPGTALTIDWSYRFDDRTADAHAWNNFLLPALSTVATALLLHAPGRAVLVTGSPSLPAAIALGASFLAPGGMSLAWQQLMPSGARQAWSIHSAPEASGFTSRIIGGRADAADFAVLVSVTNDVEAAFAASRAWLPSFRAILHVFKEGDPPHFLSSSGQAVNVVGIVVEEIRRMHRATPTDGATHLFLAAPAGLAVLLGQKLNTVGPTHTYEHIPSDAIGVYSPAARLTPGA